jgi:hypothetical protein
MASGAPRSTKRPPRRRADRDITNERNLASSTSVPGGAATVGGVHTPPRWTTQASSRAWSSTKPARRTLAVQLSADTEPSFVIGTGPRSKRPCGATRNAAKVADP